MAKIMLVEDDRSLQEIYSIRLVAEGYEIARADDGEEALAKAVQEKPDLIIADVMMPKISGFDMLDILRSQPETQNIKVIMMTALSSDDQRQRGEALGAERYLVKSQVGIEDVINAVHEVLGDKPKGDAKANIETLSNISSAEPLPRPAAPAPAAPTPAPTPAAPATPATPAAPAPAPIPAAPAPMPPVPPVAAPVAAAANALASVPTTPTTTIQPTNPAAGPAPQPVAPQPMPPANPTNGVTKNFNQAPAAMPGTVPSAQIALNPAAGAVASSPAPIPQPVANIVIPPAGQPVANNAIQDADRVMPNAAPAALQDNAIPSDNSAKSEKTSGGERVIQPIHDPRRDTMREMMEKRMEEILGGDTTDSEPQSITTKTAKKVSLEESEEPDKPATDAPVPEGVATLEASESIDDGVEESKPESEPEPEQKVEPEQKPKSKPEPEPKLEPAPEPKPEPESKLKPALEPKPESKPASTEAKPANAAPANAPTEQIEAEEEVIEPIRPGYLASLEEELSSDALAEKQETMADRMAEELKDDEITKSAQEKAAIAAAEAAKNPEAATKPDVSFLNEVVESVPTSPNISQGDEMPEPAPAQEPVIKVVTEPAPQQEEKPTLPQNAPTTAQ